MIDRLPTPGARGAARSTQSLGHKQEGSKLTWKSKSGEFDVMKPSVEGILEFATRTGLLMAPTEGR